ncbi:hypothetical protein BP6252_10044 [Coleophoma cylindrospora]|uniref:NACHT domain-containing protein n=1 Tax=Coleophoma cylindrospora TaxID=1849047 RepID=A0A3D8QXB2_9HELO|nr:hypothetical protein BP6252_10044 [Coleophoma cylindrospora]
MSDFERLGGLSKQYENIQINDNSKAHLGDTYHAHYHALPDREQCLRDLVVTDPREDKARIEQNKDRLLKQCYGWILEDTSFQRWRAKGNTRLLWIKGDPGKGKTMMTMGLVDELSSKDRLPTGKWRKLLKVKRPSSSYLVAYFFCQSTRPELNNAASVLRGLIYLLVAQRAGLISHIQNQYRARGNKIFEGINAIYALKNILSDILNDPTLPITYLLVDALDECTSGHPEFLQIITDTASAQRSRVKWLVTSRNLPSIEQFLYPSDKVSLELNASHISKAVTAFIDFKVERLAASKKYGSQTQKRVRQMLHDRAENTFLWVSLVCTELENVPSFRTESILHEFPPGLDPLYDRMLEQIQAQKDAQTRKYCMDVLRSTTLAYRPLRLKEIAVTAGLPIDQFTSVDKVNDLISHCGSFLTIRQDVVSFVHLSVKDYFTSGKGKQVFNGALIEEKERMTYRLLDAMHKTLHRDIYNLRKPGAQIQEATGHIKECILPLIAYACEYWIAHISACPQDSDNLLSDNSKTHKFLQDHLLHWLEALGWMGKISEGIQAILSLEAYISVSYILLIEI